MATSKKAGPANKGLKIAAKRERFFSGGQTEPFGYEPRVIALADLTEEQAEELRNDPYLVVEEVTVDVPKEAAKEAAK